VAGDAARRSIGSKMRFMKRFIAMISPLFKHSFLLSSSTVFMFSIQTASTGPSSISHFRVDYSERAKCRNLTASTPSDHSFETSSYEPYSCLRLIDFGFITLVSTAYYCMDCSLAQRVSALASMLRAVVLPLKGRPTTISPCLTRIIS
jgi:hypothetical protein